MGVVEGAKTSPALLKTGISSAKPDDKANEDQNAKLIRAIAESSISGSGTRLFFGERRAAVQEVLDHDGKFVLVHPEVESKLIEKNVDPYVVYVTTLIIEMQSKISQIDFIGGDVDMLTQEWSGALEEQAPVHVRQMLWLKANAEKFGYQRSGNSWKLK